MRKFLVLTTILMLAASGPVFAAADLASSQESLENVKRGSENIDWAFTEVMQHAGEEASKGTNAAEHVTGTFAGGVIGVRKGIHRVGAGAIDLLTFWIPKDKPLLDPNEPTLK